MGSSDCQSHESAFRASSRSRVRSPAPSSCSVRGSAWYLTRPKPHYVTYAVTAPGLTEYNDSGIASIKPLTIAFSESAAPLKQIKTAVTSGIDLSPAMAGTWFWTSDKELRFTPKSDWPVDGAFTVQLAANGLLARPGAARELQVQVPQPAVCPRGSPRASSIRIRAIRT